MSILDRLEAKQRRRLTVPVLVSDPHADLEVLQGLEVAHGLALQREATDEAAVLAAQIEEQARKVRAHWVDVTLQALPADEWEAAVEQWQTISLRDDGPEAEMNWAEGLPHLVAASCVDEADRDVERWKAILSGDGWSEGDIDALKRAILHLNIDAADPTVPKG